MGLGVNLALFSAIRAVFFYEPSVADPDRVVSVEPGNSDQFSYLNYLDLQDSGVFQSVAGYRLVRLNLSASGGAELISGAAVTANFFEALGIAAATGRVFGGGEAQAERQPRLAVLSHDFWRGWFGSSAGIVGQTVTINGERFDVVGVLPEGHRPLTALIEPSVLPLTLAPGCFRFARRRCLAGLRKRRYAGEHLFEQHTRVALAFFGSLLNLSAQVALDIRKSSQHVITSASESLLHFGSNDGEFVAHFGPNSDELSAHLGPQFRNLNLQRAHMLPERRHLRREGSLKTFDAIGQRLIWHCSSVPPGISRTTLPSSELANNGSGRAAIDFQ